MSDLAGPAAPAAARTRIMPTINKRFLLKLLLLVVALGGLLTGGHALQARRIPDALLRQADRAAEAGKSDAAIHYLRQYLEFEPDDVAALEKLTELLRQRNPSSRPAPDLVFLYDKILRLDPERHAVRREALALCLKLGRYTDAIAHADALLTVYPTEAGLSHQLGAAYAGLNKLPEARKAYETAIAHTPGELLGYQRLAQLLWKNANDPAAAKQVLNRMVEALPQEAEAYLIRARFELFLVEDATRGGTTPATVEAALRDLRRVLELDPENADASLALAETLQKGRDVTAAHAILREAAALYPRDLRIIRSLSWLELVRGNAPAAIAVLEEGLKHTPAGFDLLVPLADLLVQQGDTTRTAEILKRLETHRAPPAQVKYLQARIAMRQAKWAEAVGLLEMLRTETRNLPGLETQLNLLLATCFERTGDSDAQEKAFKRVTNADPANVAARVSLATFYLNHGKLDDAIREYDAATPSPYATGGVHAQAVRLKARRLWLRGGTPDEWRRLEAAVAAAAPSFGPVSSEPAILRAELAATQGRYAEAVQMLRKETVRRPGDTRLWAILAAMAADAAGTPAGLMVMDEAQAAAGDGPAIRLARATLYAREPGRVRPIEPLAERIESWAEADQLRLLAGLVEVYDEQDDRAAVVRVLKQLATHRPTDAAVWMRLHERSTAAGDERTAASARAALGRIEGENGAAVLLCDALGAKDPKIAERLVATFGPSPNRADACLSLARLKALAGDPAEELRLTERAFTLEPTRHETIRAWLALLGRTGADDRAMKFVARLAADPRWAGEPFRRLVRRAAEQLPPATTMKLLAWCRPFVEKEPGGLGWLAGRYAAVGAARDADATHVTATMSPTTTADDWFRLVLHHAAAGRRDAAEDVLKTCRGKLSTPLFFALAAAVLETPGARDWNLTVTDPAEQRLFAQARLAVKLSRSDHVGAANVLEEYVAVKDRAPHDADWAKRNLAMLYAVGGTPEDRKRAMQLIAEVAEVGATPDDLRATASALTTLSRYLDGEDRRGVLRRAISALAAAHKISNSPKDLYNLAQLHRAAGDGAASRTCLNALLKADPDNIYYLTIALEELTDKGELTAGEAFAARLARLYPGEFRAVATVARFECRAGRPERALAIAEGYAAAADTAAGDHLTRSARVAELLDELVRLPGVRGTPLGKRMTDAAVERYAALVQAQPEAVIGIAGVLAADGRLAEAFGRIDQFDRYVPKRLRALAGLAAVRAGGASDRQFTLVGGWLDETLGEDPQSVPLRLNRAELLTLRQDVQGATAIYEDILRAEPRNVIALNNLAWLLAADPATAERALELVSRATREVGLTGDLLDTRARVRITLKQFNNAERDLGEAARQDPTALRYFHVAVLKLAESPARPDEAAAAFKEARARGLEPRAIHPADLPTYRVLENAKRQ